MGVYSLATDKGLIQLLIKLCKNLPIWPCYRPCWRLLTQKLQAYIVAGSFVFGAIFAGTAATVIALIALPTLLAGYLYATELPHYAWGMLLELCAFIFVEYQLYGPVYKTTGIVYGISFFVAIGAASLGYLIFRSKNKWLERRSYGIENLYSRF